MAMVAVAAILLLAAVPVYAQTEAPSEVPSEAPSPPASEPPSEPATPTLVTPERDMPVTGPPFLDVAVDGKAELLTVTLTPADSAVDSTTWAEQKTSQSDEQSSISLSLTDPPCPLGVQRPCALANGRYTLTVVADDAEEPLVEDQPIVLEVDPPPPGVWARLRKGGRIKVSGQALELPDSQPAELYRLGNPDELLDTFKLKRGEAIAFEHAGPEGGRLEPGIYSYRLQVARAGAGGTSRMAEATSSPLVEVVAPDTIDPPDPIDPTEPPDPVDPTEPPDPVDPTEPPDPVDPTEPPDPVDPTEPTEPSEPDPKPDRSAGDPTDDGGQQRNDSDGDDDDRQVALGSMNVGSAGSLTSPFTRSSLALSAPGPGVSTGLASQNLPEIAPPAVAAPQVAVPEIPAPAPLPLTAFPAPAPAVAPAAQPPPSLPSLLGILPQPLATSPVMIASRSASSDLPPAVPVAAWALLAGVLGWRLVSRSNTAAKTRP